MISSIASLCSLISTYFPCLEVDSESQGHVSKMAKGNMGREDYGDPGMFQLVLIPFVASIIDSLIVGLYPISSKYNLATSNISEGAVHYTSDYNQPSMFHLVCFPFLSPEGLIRT